ncbi:uncharacterized protein K460DRAFT_258971, partial [Cucurbitaria berberidis CBS 394.84]
FFELPRELRDLVYHFLWYDYPDLAVLYRGKWCVVGYQTMNALSTKGQIQQRSHRLPAWLFINKLFHKEAIFALNERAEWTWFPYWRHQPGAGSSTLFGPSTSQLVTLKLGDLAPTSRQPFVMESLAERARSLNQSCRNLIDDHRHISADMLASEKPQDLHIWFDLPEDADEDTFECFANMDLEFLELFQRIQLRDLVIYV